MLEEEGLVKAVTGDKALVLMRRKGACAQCVARKACHALDDGKEMEAQVFNPINATVGDRVRITMKEEVLLKGSFILYFVPTLGIIAGSCLGHYIGKLRGWDVDLSAMLLGLLFLSFSFLIAFFISRHLKGAKRYSPQIQEVIAQADREFTDQESISCQEDEDKGSRDEIV